MDRLVRVEVGDESIVVPRGDGPAREADLDGRIRLAAGRPRGLEIEILTSYTFTFQNSLQ